MILLSHTLWLCVWGNVWRKLLFSVYCHSVRHAGSFSIHTLVTVIFFPRIRNLSVFSLLLHYVTLKHTHTQPQPCVAPIVKDT